MSEQQQPAPEAPKPAPPAPDQGATPEEEAALGDAGKQALDRMKAERNQATKEAAALKKQLDALNVEKLSDLEKAQKIATDAQTEAATARLESLRYRVAAEVGMTPADKPELVLTMSDEAAMREQAELWKSRQAPAGAAPRPDLSQGGKAGSPGSGSPEQDFAKWLAPHTGATG